MQGRIKTFWSNLNSCEVLNKPKSLGFHASGLSTYDFSAVYTTLPHNFIEDKLVDLTERAFQREFSLHIAFMTGVLLLPLKHPDIITNVFFFRKCVSSHLSLG